MTNTTLKPPTTVEHPPSRTGSRMPLFAAVAVLVLASLWIVVDASAWRTWLTLFVSVLLQALPFLVLGVTISGLIAGFVTPGLLDRITPESESGSVVVATCAGVLLPGCECGSVPISDRLIRGGLAPAAALAFMLSAPAINPIVMVSTAVAFPGQPEMVVARFLASFAVAMAIGLWWAKRRSSEALGRVEATVDGSKSRTETFVHTAGHDFLHAGGFLVIGAAAAAAIQAFVPQQILDIFGSSPLLAILGMVALAIVLSICSEADAFVAASFTNISPTAQLAFMVTGPVADLKLVSLQAGIFGSRFASRFAPATVVAAIGASIVMGWVFL